MNENKQNIDSGNYYDEKSNDSDISSQNENTNIIVKDVIMKFKLLICFKKYINIISKYIHTFFSHLSILSQYLFFFIPFMCILLLSLLLIHYHAFEKLFKFDFYFAIKEEYLKPITTDLDDIHFDIGSFGIKNSYEDLESLFFFKIYFKELISMGLLNEKLKIFPNISNNSETLYKSFDLYQGEIQMNSHYTIPKNDTEYFIDNRNDSFSELGKLYYHMLPTISFESYSRDLYINQSYLIAYEYDNNTYKINPEYLNFAFPRFDNQVYSSNFIIDNSYVWPKISDEEVTHGEKYNNSFYKENWFIKQDYDFRVSANEENNIKLSIANLNFNYFGKMNKSYVLCFQNYESSNGKNFIINLIFFIKQRNIIEESFHYSTFMVFNESSPMFIEEKERYSDNFTYLIFKSNIIELSLSSILYRYFHYGMYDKNYNFYRYGSSFDGFDIEQLGEPLKYYNSLKNFNIDLRYFSSLYLYTFLFIKSNFNISLNGKTKINEFNFEKNEIIMRNICKEFNYSSYKEYLINEDIDCWNIQNLLYYAEKEVPNDQSLHNYMSIPYCICLPLYCLSNNYEDFNPNKIYFVEKIKLPERCQNHLKYYENNDTNEISGDKIVQFEEKMNFFTNNLKEKIEDEFFIYKFMPYSYIKGIFLLIINLVDNSILENILNIYLYNISLFQFYILFSITIAYLILILVVMNIIILNIKKISVVIFDFHAKHENCLYQLNENNENYIDNNNEIKNTYLENKIDNIFNYSENRPLLKNEEENEELEDYSNNTFYNISSESPLLDDLFKIFNKYYNTSIDNLIKSNNKSENLNILKAKIKLVEEKNELFKLLMILSLHSHKFKLNISMEYNYYIKSKLNQNYLKFIKKNKFFSTHNTHLTQNVIYELLSTENIEDYGILTNINFKYISNINLNNRINNSIKKAVFRYNSNDNIRKINDDNIINNNNKIIFKEDRNNNIKIMYKERNNLLRELDSNFENDDFLKKEKLESSFDFFLINVYYKYIKKLIPSSESIQQRKNLD